jgi:endonuclease YncB( thermonuclease family)
VSGVAARDALVQLVGTTQGRSREGHVLVTGKPLRCVSYGSGKGNRTAASCVTARGIDIGCAMVRGGFAVRWAQHERRRKVCG